MERKVALARLVLSIIIVDSGRTLTRDYLRLKVGAMPMLDASAIVTCMSSDPTVSDTISVST